MKIIIHLSDLHFGKNRPILEKKLLDIVNLYRSDLVVVSGDITQRATAEEFRQAQRFFALFSCPIIAIPGNHDIPPFFSFRGRFSRPYKNYHKYISQTTEPFYIDEELAISGVDSVCPAKFYEGRLNVRQFPKVQKEFSKLSPKMMKIIIMHHPLNLPLRYPGKVIGKARMALNFFQTVGVDLVLSGHLHSTLHKYRNALYRIPRKGPLIIHAGTAISSRMRTEPNSFNVIIIYRKHIKVKRYEFRKTKFVIARIEKFRKKTQGWVRDAEE